MKGSKKKLTPQVVDTKEMPSVTAPLPTYQNFRGPGLNVPKTLKDYSKKGK
jgi:hypothetical protein